MKVYVGLLLGSVYLFAPGAASAQTTLGRPVLSPYLNLLQAGQPPGVNYYALVRPEIEFRASIQKLQQQSLASQQPAEAQNALAIPTTGHFAGFMTQGTYFQSLTGGAAGGSLTNPAGTGTGVRPPNAPTAPRSGR